MPKSDVALSTLAKAAMASLIAAGALFAPSASFADEGGVSFWLPGLFGSLAAVPQQQPGFSLANIYYHDDVTAGSDVARAREISIGKLPSTLNVNLSGNLHAYADLNLLIANYAFATPVLGGQLMVTPRSWSWISVIPAQAGIQRFQSLAHCSLPGTSLGPRPLFPARGRPRGATSLLAGGISSYAHSRQ